MKILSVLQIEKSFLRVLFPMYFSAVHPAQRTVDVEVIHIMQLFCAASLGIKSHFGISKPPIQRSQTTNHIPRNSNKAQSHRFPSSSKSQSSSLFQTPFRRRSVPSCLDRSPVIPSNEPFARSVPWFTVRRRSLRWFARSLDCLWEID